MGEKKLPAVRIVSHSIFHNRKTYGPLLRLHDPATMEKPVMQTHLLFLHSEFMSPEQGDDAALSHIPPGTLSVRNRCKAIIARMFLKTDNF